MRIQGIRTRLVLILAAAAVTIVFASIAALVALSEVNDELDTITEEDLPAITAALRLVHIGERLQYQGSVLFSARERASRADQQRLIETDMSTLVAEVERLRATTPEGRLIINSINDTAVNLNKNLRALNRYLSDQTDFADELTQQRSNVLQTQQAVKQLLGPSILAIDGIANQAEAIESRTYQLGIQALGPLLSAERLVNNAVEYLLLSISSDNNPTINQLELQFQRTLAELRQLIRILPAGLQEGVSLHLAALEKQLQEPGVFNIRRSELAMLAQANLEMTKINMESVSLKSLVDDLVVTTNMEIGSITTRIGKTVTQNTIWFVSGSMIVMLLLTLFSWLWVVRPVGKNLMGITRAMSRLAEGEHGVQIPEIERGDEIGDLARAFTVFKDNMAQMEILDRELTEKSSLLVTTFDNMNDGLTIFDGEQNLIAWNPQFLKLYDMPEDFVAVGRSITDIHQLLAERGIHASTTMGESLPINQLAKYRQTDTLRYEVQCPNGRVLELRSNPLTSGGFVTLHMDITERLAIEAQLRQAQKMEVVGQLTGGIAHDFNNILAVITGNLHIIDRESIEGSVLKERTHKALGAVNRATRQIEHLLAFSRRQKLEPEAVDVNKLIENMMDFFGHSLGNNVELSTYFADALPKVHVDPGQLENALMNLAVNARDALKHKGKIIFSTQQLAEPFVEIAVKDDGMGIPEDIIDNVFEPFFTTKPVGKGSGLGLSMVYGFVTQSGGTVHITSRPYQGTTISMHLPISDKQTHTVSADLPLTPSYDKIILVVDDDKDLLEITAGQIRELGYQVYTADGGELALKILREHPDIDLLYTDVVMPEPWSGMALAEAAQSIKSDLQILFTSAEASELANTEAGILKKPVTKESLAKKLSQTLSTSASKI